MAQLGGYNSANAVMLGESVDVVIARKLNGQLPLVLKTPDYVDDMTSLEDTYVSLLIANTAGTLAEVLDAARPARTWGQAVRQHLVDAASGHRARPEGTPQGAARSNDHEHHGAAE